MFPLPGQAARRAILGIHTRRWDPPPPPPLLAELAQRCVGFCGADLKARLRAGAGAAPSAERACRTCMLRRSRVTICAQAQTLRRARGACS